MIDETRNLVLSVFTGELDPELVVSIAEGLTVVDSPSRYIH